MAFQKESYQKMTGEALAICHQEMFINNFNYLVYTDLNFKEYVKTLLVNLKYMIGDLEKEPEMYYGFKMETKNVNYVLNSLFQAARAVNCTKNKSAEEILEPCMVFHDSGGQHFIKSIGVFVITSAILKQLSLADKMNVLNQSEEEYLKLVNHPSLDSLKKRKQKRLQIEEGDFVDHAAYRDCLDQNFEKINESFVKNLETVKSFVMCLDNQHTDTVLLNIGIEFWNNELKRKDENTEVLKNIINVLSN